MTEAKTGHTPTRGLTYLYMTAAFVIVVAGMRAAEPILNPLLLAVFLAVISAPAYFGLLKRGFSNWLSLLIVIGVLSFVVLGVVLVVMESIAGFTSHQEHYQERLTEETDKLETRIRAFLPDWSETVEESAAADQNAVDTDTNDQQVADGENQSGEDRSSTADAVDESPSTESPALGDLPGADDQGAEIAGHVDSVQDIDRDSPVTAAQDSESEVATTENSGSEFHREPIASRSPSAIGFGSPEKELPGDAQSWRDYMFEQFNLGTAISLAGSIVASIGHILSNAFLILLTVIFILLEAGTFNHKMQDAFTHTEEAAQRGHTIIESIHRYIVIKTWVSLGTGLLIAMWLKFLCVPYASLWGLLAFFFNFIPNVGSIIAAVPAVLIAWLDLNALPAVACAVGYLVVNTAIGNFIEPRLMGKGLGLSPLVVFCSMLFWGWVLGPIGMLLSVPLTMTVRIALGGFDDTRWIATLMGNVESA